MEPDLYGFSKFFIPVTRDMRFSDNWLPVISEKYLVDDAFAYYLIKNMLFYGLFSLWCTGNDWDM